jgi:hypothetical protein
MQPGCPIAKPFTSLKVIDRRWFCRAAQRMLSRPSDLSPKFPPLRSRVLGCRHDHVTVFLGSVERRFSAPADFLTVVARSLGHDWPQATGEAGADGAHRARAMGARLRS